MIVFRKFKILCNVIHGYLFKWLVDLHVFKVPKLNGSIPLVASLTSYGRRVKSEVVYYTIVSLLRQRVHPSRIILWLAVDEWNNASLPKRLKSLCEKGVEIRYCQDLRSYKRLIPTLKLIPDQPIMTVDDDVIYSSNTIGPMWEEHLRRPTQILCYYAVKPLFANGIPSRYEQWKEVAAMIEDKQIFPIGAGCVLYPVGSLHKDVLRADLFMSLCPYADDIWFWYCGLRNCTMKYTLQLRGKHVTFDALYQYFHKGSVLTHTNRMEHANDRQFRKLYEYYVTCN